MAPSSGRRVSGGRAPQTTSRQGGHPSFWGKAESGVAGGQRGDEEVELAADGLGGAADASGEERDLGARAARRAEPEGEDWDSEAPPRSDPPGALDGPGRFVTPSTYRGSPREPRVFLTARADAVGPAADVDVMLCVGGRVVRRARVGAGTYFELGEHPLGVSVAVDVENTSGAGMVRASILQDNCFAETAWCEEAGCTAHAEYTTGLQLCHN